MPTQIDELTDRVIRKFCETLFDEEGISASGAYKHAGERSDEKGERHDEGHTQQTCSDVGEMAELRDFIFVEIPKGQHCAGR